MSDRWLTFDCFGTLIDWRHGIRTTGELLFPGRGADFLAAYATLEAEVVVDFGAFGSACEAAASRACFKLRGAVEFLCGSGLCGIQRSGLRVLQVIPHS